MEAPAIIGLAVAATTLINALLNWLFKARDSGKAVGVNERSVSARIDAAFGRVEEMERNRIEMERARKEIQDVRDARDNERWARVEKRMEMLEGWIRPPRGG